VSYDISFKAKIEGTDVYVDVGECWANITWNVRDMIKASTGLEWRNEENNGLCSEVIQAIGKGYVELINNPESYKKYEAPNGWGTVEGTKRFFRNILDAWDKLKESDPELAKVAVFWIG